MVAPMMAQDEIAKKAEDILADLKAALPVEQHVEPSPQMTDQEYRDLFDQTANLSAEEIAGYVDGYLARRQERIDQTRQEQSNVEEQVAQLKAEAGIPA